MIIVIPMAGRGRRFVDAGYTTPKPLIPVLGRPMYAWAVESLPLELATKLVFIVLADQLDDTLTADISERFGRFDTEVIALDEVTEGQACTVLTARSIIDDDIPLLVYNADTWCRTNLGRTLEAMPSTVDGVIGVFEAPGDHWSFARVDADGRVLETAEKKRISPWATTGLYYFTRGSDFVHEADQMVAEDDRTRGEFYVAPLYNRLIARGADIRIDVALEVGVMGTPSELAEFTRNRS